MESLTSTSMAASQLRHFGSGGKRGQSGRIWPSGTPKIPAHVVGAAVSMGWDPPQMGAGANSSPGIRGAKTFARNTQKGGGPHFPGITEAGSRPLPREPSPTPQRAAPCHADLTGHRAPEALPRWTGDFACPAAHLAPEVLAHRADSQTCRLRLWGSVRCPPQMAVCVYIPPGL